MALITAGLQIPPAGDLFPRTRRWRTVKPCPSPAAARRPLRRGEPMDDACRIVERDRRRESRAAERYAAAALRPWQVTRPAAPVTPADPSLPHQIQLRQKMPDTAVTCNCGAWLGFFRPADVDAMLAAYRIHELLTPLTDGGPS